MPFDRFPSLFVPFATTRLPLAMAAALLLCLSGCLAGQPDHADSTVPAAAADWPRATAFFVPTTRFDLYAVRRLQAHGGSADLYIEGDGLAWLSEREPSRDPTPRDPLSLRLAARDPAPNVIYLARPCQFGSWPKRACTAAYWTGKRFAPEVIDSYDEALTQLKAAHRLTGFNLIGYSGGGAVAALLAARRTDILSLRTVAGNLDTDRFTRLHAVSSLVGSLNPAAGAARLETLPQRHFTGGADRIVTASVLAGYAAHLQDKRCLSVTTVAGNDHNHGWAEQWPALLQLPVTCAP